MRLRIPAGPRRRTRRALLAAALTAVLAAVALPSAAQAAEVSGGQTGVSVLDRSFFSGASIETNDVTVSVEGSFLAVTDSAGISTAQQGSGGTCFRFSSVEARCPLSITKVDIALAGGNDRVEYRAPHAGSVFLGDGADRVIAGVREAAGRTIQPVLYSGGGGSDSIIYSAADRGVSLTPEDNLANDGRPGDMENVQADFEVIFGSHFPDAPLFGTPNSDTIFGLEGRDIIAGGLSDDLFITLSGDGADDYHGGPGRDTIDYSGRSQPLTVFLDNVADDGEFNEHDNVRSNVENVIGGSAADGLHSLGAFSRLEGRGGADTLIGGSGPDTLIGGPGIDRLDAGTENDVIDSLDGEAENVDCGPGEDTLLRDFDGFVGCENIKVGVLRLAPKAVTAKAGKPAHLRLSWRHPERWRKLRKVELRLYRDGAPVGEIMIRPRTQRITTDGVVKLARKHTRLTRKGKAVTARLALRLDASLAGETLTAEVEATDTRGRRQLERDAGRIRVSG